MKRRIFFWLDKLKVSRTERQAISYLLMFLIGIMGINAVVSPSAPFDQTYYSELDQRFSTRTALMKQENRQLMARYKGQPASPVQTDTLEPAGSTKAEMSVQPSTGTLINVNTADAQTLQELTGIGAAYAQRVITYRQKNGAFNSKEELLKIKGIGPARLGKIKSFITLGDSGLTVEPAAVDTIQKVQNKKPQPDHDETDEQQIININTADVTALQKLQGIGPAYARRIVDYRQKNGAFTQKNELLKIKGIGKKRLANIKPFIKLTGQQ